LCSSISLASSHLAWARRPCHGKDSHAPRGPSRSAQTAVRGADPTKTGGRHSPREWPSVASCAHLAASSRREARFCRRRVTSGVSALWGFVANGHHAMQHGSSDLSKIPYGGFSPVRLQTGNIHRHLHRLRRLIGSLKRRRPPGLVFPALSRGEGRDRRCIPVQRPLARRRVMLSRRVNAYYGLIRASGAAPVGLFFSPAGLCLAAAGQKVPAFSLRILLFVPPSVPRQTGRPRTIVRPPVIAFARMRGARRLQCPT
jgi:hypothetical protein